MVTFESEEWCAVQRQLLVESFLLEQVAFNLFFAPLLMASSFPVTMFKRLFPARPKDFAFPIITNGED